MTGSFNLCAIKVFIFDVNGVLIDSNHANAQAMAEAFTPERSLWGPIRELYLGLTGIDRGTKIRTVQERVIGKPFSEGEFELRWDRFKESANRAMARAPLTAGCCEVLAELGNRGAVRAALSNTPEPELKEILKKQGLEPLLELVRGGGDRPKSESLAGFLSESGLRADECVFLGDGRGDLRAARHAGVPFFGIDAGTLEFEGEKDVMGPFENLAEWGRDVFGLRIG